MNKPFGADRTSARVLPASRDQRLASAVWSLTGSLALGALMLSAQPAAAVDKTYIGPDNGDFSVPGSWSPTGVPTGDNADVASGKTVTITSNQRTNDINAGGNFGGGNTGATAITGSGTYIQTGAATTLSVGGWFRYGVTSGATGTFNLNEGTVNMAGGQLNLGEAAGGVGFLNMNGGTFNLNGGSPLQIGRDGTGTLNISTSTFNNNSTQGFSGIGVNNGGVGTMTVSGTGSYLVSTASNDLNVSDNGGSRGTLNVSGQGQVNLKAGALFVGKNANNVGTVNLGDGTPYDGTTTTDTITTKVIVGGAGAGTFNFNGGRLAANVAATPAFMGGTQVTRANVRNGGAFIDTNSNAAITISQALLHSNVAGDAATDGGLTKLGVGTLLLTAVNTYTGPTTISTGTLQLGNGTTDGTIATTSGVVDNAALVYNLTTSRAAPYVISGPGTVTLNDTGTNKGTLSLSNANTYTGATTITSGILALDHSGANTGALGNTAVSIGGGTSLLAKGNAAVGSAAGGTGSISVAGGTTTATQGILDLRDLTVNSLDVGGNLNVVDGSVLDFDLGTTNLSSDVVNVGVNGAGVVTPTGTTTVNINALGSVPAGTTKYVLINAPNGGLTAGGAGFQIGSKPGGFSTFTLTDSTARQLILTVTANATPTTEYWTGQASASGGDASNNWGFGTTLSPQKSNWSTTADGLNDPLQVPGANTDTTFTAANAVANNGVLNTQLDGAYSLKSLTFNTSLASSPITSVIVNANGNTLTMGGGGLTVAAANPASTAITPGSTATPNNGSGTIVLNGNQAWANNSAQPLTVGTGITGQATTGNTQLLTFNGTGAGDVTLGGVLGNGTLGGNLALTVNKSGAGVLALNAINTFTGGVTLNSGTVRAGAGAALNTNAITFGAGSTSVLQTNGNNVTVGSLTTDATTVGTPIIENGSATAGTLITTDTASDTFAGVLRDGTGGGKLGLTKAGANTSNLTLSGANTFTGPVIINNGSITATNSSSLGAGPKLVTISAGTAGNANLRLNSGGGAGITLPAGINFDTSNTAGAIFNDAGDNTIAGNINLVAGGGNTGIISNGGSLLLSGNISTALNSRDLILGGTALGTVSGNIAPATGGVLILRKQGTGTWNINGTANAVQNFFVQGGTAVLGDGSNVTSAGFSGPGVNAGENGTLTLNGSANLTVAADFNVSDNANSTGTVNLNGTGNFKVNTLFVGKSGGTTGTVNQTGGTLSQNAAGGEWRIGGSGGTGDATSVGVYNISGGTLSTGNSSLQVGAFGTGTLNQTGGTVNSGAFTTSGRFVGGVGNINVLGGNFNQTGTGNVRLFAAEEGTGTITVGSQTSNGTTTNGIITSTSGLVIGLAATGNGQFNLNTGGTLITPFISGAPAPGTTSAGGSLFNFSGGTLRASASDPTTTAPATAPFMKGIKIVNVNAGGAKIDTGAFNITVATPLLHGEAVDGGLTKTGTGALTLTGASTYTGMTTVLGGMLVVNGSTVAPVTVGNGTTLMGGTQDPTMAATVGAVGPVTVQSGGTHAPGNSPGVQQTGDYNLQQGGTLLIDMAGGGAAPVAGTNYDQVQVIGTDTLAGLLRINATTAPDMAATYTIMTNDNTDPVVGAFSNAPRTGDTGLVRAVVGGSLYQFTVNYAGGDGNDVTLSNAQVSTSVNLVGFKAQAVSGGTWVWWKTGYEVNNLGFNVYRQVRDGKGKWGALVKVNPRLIAGAQMQGNKNAAKGGGFVYAYGDKLNSNTTPYRNLRYWLEDVDADGTLAKHGPASVVQGQGALGDTTHPNSPLAAQ